MTYSPFAVAQGIGNNISSGIKQGKDENLIENILSEASASEDPRVLQNAIGKILSSVSPERQPGAIKYLEHVYENIQEKQKLSRDEATKRQSREDQIAAGVAPGVAPAVQSQLLKDKAKAGRLAQYGLGQPQSQYNLPNAENGTPKSLQGGDAQPVQQTMQNPFETMSKSQLTPLTGHPDKEISEPAKAQLKLIADKEELAQREKDGNRKHHTEISQDILKENEKEARSIIESESALGLMESALANKDLSFFTFDNLAELSGLEGFRSKEGALFKTAGKEFFLGTLTRAGARPNQFIEQQIAEMLPKIGRSTAANLSVSRAFRNEIDLKREKVRLTRDLADQLEAQLGYVPRNIGQIRDEKFRAYAEGKQKELNNDLRALKAIEDKKAQSFMKVNPGTPVSKVVAKAILDQYDKKDPERTKKAAKQAEELGYVF